MISTDYAAFLADVQATRKPATVKFYRSRGRWIVSAFASRESTSLQEAEVKRACDAANRWPDGRPKAPDTIRANMIAWHQFEAWLIDTGRLTSPIVSQAFKKPAGRQREMLPDVDQIKKILLRSNREFSRIYRALLMTGARPDELCRAQIVDYDRDERVIRLQDHKTVGKSKRPRRIPIGKHCLHLINEAIGKRTEGPIFVTEQGRPWKRSHLSAMFRRLRDRAGVPREIVLYATRHAAATQLCQAVGISAAGEVLGHADLRTTQRYVHHDDAHLVQAVDVLQAPTKPRERRAKPRK